MKGKQFAVAHAIANNHAGYYPGAQLTLVKAVYSVPDGIIYGAQVVGHGEGIDKRNDVLATAIANKMTVYDLQYLDLSYSPPFGSAKDVVNHLATICVDQMHGLHPSVTWDEFEQLGDVQIVDVRTESEFKQGSIPGAKLIPLNVLRNRLGEIDKNKEAVVYCRVGMRGYLATRLLQEYGFTKVRNLLGGYTLYNELDKAKLIDNSNKKATKNSAL